ncbi:MAG TPA: glycosyltransferase [Acidobacteriaceae bacterium]
MARIGAFCFPGTGHIHPMTALGRRLMERGHTFVLFGIADTEERIRAGGVEFHRIGASDYPPGTLAALDRRLGELKGLATFRFTVERVKDTARMILRDGPEAVRQSGVDYLLVDEADMGSNVAEHLGIPFVSVAFFPPLMEGHSIPPFCFGWRAGRGPLNRLRNYLGARLLSRVAWPIFALVNKQRALWGLKPPKRSTDVLSSLAQIAQLPAALEFASVEKPEVLHYTGPFVDARARKPVDFPWERLDGRRLVYASLGTLQNGSECVFQQMAAACAGEDLQLVISLGGGLDPERLGALAGDPIVVRYAPQLEMLKRASAVITHAGLNTVLEALAEGVPLVCLPLGNDQPGVAARVAERGAGMVLTRRNLNPQRLRAAVLAVLDRPQYREAAQYIQQAMREVDGLQRAVVLIEEAFGLGTLGLVAGVPAEESVSSAKQAVGISA